MANVSPSKSASQSAGTGKAAPKGSGKAGGSRRDRLASFEAARKKEQRNRTIRLLVICGVLAMALLAYPVYLFVDDYQARNATLASLGIDVAAAGCDPGREPGVGQPGPRRGRHQGGLHRVPARLRPALPQPGALRQALLHDERPAPGRDPRAQPGARLHHGLVPRRRPGRRREDPGEHRQDLLQRRLQPGRQVHRGALGRVRRRPSRRARTWCSTRWTADPVDPSDTTKQFGVRQSLRRQSAARRSRTSWPSTRWPTPPNPTARDLRCAHRSSSYRAPTTAEESPEALFPVTREPVAGAMREQRHA